MDCFTFQRIHSSSPFFHSPASRQSFVGQNRILEGYKRPIKARDFDTGVLEFTAASMIHGNAVGNVDFERLSQLKCLVIGGQKDSEWLSLTAASEILR